MHEQLNRVYTNKYSCIRYGTSCIFLMLGIFARAPPAHGLLSISERTVREMKKCLNYFCQRGKVLSGLADIMVSRGGKGDA